VSCRTISIDEFTKTTPVRPPIVNRNTKPNAHKQGALYVIRVPYIVASHLKILIPKLGCFWHSKNDVAIPNVPNNGLSPLLQENASWTEVYKEYCSLGCDNL